MSYSEPRATSEVLPVDPSNPFQCRTCGSIYKSRKFPHENPYSKGLCGERTLLRQRLVELRVAQGREMMRASDQWAIIKHVVGTKGIVRWTSSVHSRMRFSKAEERYIVEDYFETKTLWAPEGVVRLAFETYKLGRTLRIRAMNRANLDDEFGLGLRAALCENTLHAREEVLRAFVNA